MTQPRLHTLCLVAALLLASVRLEAAETATPTNAAGTAATGDLDNLSKAEILKLIQNLADELKQTRSELERMKATHPAETPNVAPPAAPATPAVPPAPPEVTTVAPAPTNAPPALTTPAEPSKEQTEAEKDRERQERERAIQSVQSSDVLLHPGQFDVEPSVTYSHTSLNLINVDGFAILPVLVVGDIQSLRVERDVFNTTLALRYGIMRNLQADVSLPWQYEEDRYVTQSAQNSQSVAPKETYRQDQGIGDVQFGLSYQALHEHGAVPDLIIQSEARAPTGKSEFDFHSQFELPQGMGVWGDRIGFTAIKSMDPVVLVFSTGYTYNFGHDFIVQHITSTSTNLENTTYQPGANVDVAVAVAVAMNPSFAINLGVLERYTFRTELAGIGAVQGSSLNEAQFRFGFAWALSRNTVLNFTAAAGLTEDTPGLSVTLSLPMKF